MGLVKRIGLPVISLLLAISVLIAATSMYLTTYDSKINTVTIGDVKIDLTEPNWEDTENVVPNQELAKDPQVTNTGINDAIIFMTVEVPVEEITLTSDDGTKGAKARSELFWFKDSSDGLSTHANNFDSNWIHIDTRDDGADMTGESRTYVFAYRVPLAKDETTTPLFDKIQVKNFIENEIAAGSTKKININTYAIQASDVLENNVDLSDNLTTGNLTKMYDIYINTKVTYPQSVPYQITYRFKPVQRNSNTKSDGLNNYIVKGVLEGDDVRTAIEPEGKDGFKLRNSFIIQNTPLESNQNQNLYWNTSNIEKSTDSNCLTATVTATQVMQKVTVNYRLTPDEDFVSFETGIGYNRGNDPQIGALDVRNQTYNGKEFSYWEIRDKNQQLATKCYNPYFNFCIWFDSYISPVFEGACTPDLASEQGIRMITTNTFRNQWTDDNGNMLADAKSDCIYTSFQISYSDGGADIRNDSSYKIGMVWEFCGKHEDDNQPFDPNNYSYVSNIENLKQTIKEIYASNPTNGGSGLCEYEEGKRRTVRLAVFQNSVLTNENRVNFIKPFYNTYEIIDGKKSLKNGAYIYKFYACLIKGDEVYLSEPIVHSYYNVAVGTTGIYTPEEMWTTE